MTYVVNDKIKLIDGSDAIIKFIGKTRLDNTIWFGIEYMSSLTSSFKPTLITIADIKSLKKKSYESKSSKKKLRAHNKTSSSILTTNAINTYKKRIKSPRKHSNESIFQQKVNQSLAKKSVKKQKQKKKERCSSAPSKTIETHLIAMDTMDINNTFAINDNFDAISSTINDNFDAVTNINNYKNKIKKKKRRNKYHSDITANILSLSALAKKKKNTKNTQKQSSPSLTMECMDNYKNMPSANPIIGSAKSEDTKAVSPSYSTNIDFAALIDDNNIILNEEKEFENDVRFKQQYSKIFSSIKNTKNGERKKHKKLSHKADNSDGDDFGVDDIMD